MNAPTHIANAARERISGSLGLIRASMSAIAAGRPGDAEPELTRRAAVLQRRLGMSYDEATRRAPASGAEKVWGKTIDFVDVVFLERGMHAARSVARVATPDGQGLGTGFMISPRLFMTNNHVIPTKAAARDLVVEFDYERDRLGGLKRVTRFALDSGKCFLTNHEDDLDYTVVAIGEVLQGGVDLTAFGYLPISGARDKHQLGDHVNLIQHPDARLKEAVLRENQLVARAKTALHYVADTEPGSSGSPVFNVLWDVVALHHWGGPHRDLIDENGKPLAKTVNEGIRISSIVGDLNTRKNGLAAGERDFINEALTAGLNPESAPRSEVPSDPAFASPAGAASVQIGADGTATWTIPLRVSVQLGGLPTSKPSTLVPDTPSRHTPGVTTAPGIGEKAVVIDDDYSNRSGYDPRFLDLVHIPLPTLKTEAARSDLAINQEPAPGRPRHELPYEHFSVVMNGRRRLAFFTATNIDGKLAKNYDRDTGVITDIYPDDESGDEGAEATERWFPERRITDDEQTPPALYEGQTTFDSDGQPIQDRRTAAHRNRMFQQGHLTRRQDPLWGTDEVVIRANADTFHVTNRAPQVGFFNMGIRKAGAEAGGHAGGQLHWRAMEDFVLNNAVADKSRVTVFTGPIFDDQYDMPWDRGMPELQGFKAPREFWKIVVRVENGRLRATALLADQAPLIDYVPEAVLSDAEVARVSFEKVRKYHVSVAEVETRTSIDFGEAVREADTHGGGERREVTSLNQLFDVPANASTGKAKPAAVAKKRSPSKKPRT